MWILSRVRSYWVKTGVIQTTTQRSSGTHPTTEEERYREVFIRNRPFHRFRSIGWEAWSGDSVGSDFKKHNFVGMCPMMAFRIGRKEETCLVRWCPPSRKSVSFPSLSLWVLNFKKISLVEDYFCQWYRNSLYWLHWNWHWVWTDEYSADGHFDCQRLTKNIKDIRGKLQACLAWIFYDHLSNWWMRLMEIICLHLYFWSLFCHCKTWLGVHSRRPLALLEWPPTKNIFIPPEYTVNVMAETSSKFSDMVLVEPLRASSHLLIGILNASPLVVAGDTFLDRVGSIFMTGFILHSKTRTGVQFNSIQFQFNSSNFIIPNGKFRWPFTFEQVNGKC